MSQKLKKVVFRVATGFLTVIVFMFVANSIFNQEVFANRFQTLGYPSYIIYPLVVAKILGLIAIWSNRSATLKEWAYAGSSSILFWRFWPNCGLRRGELISTSIALLSLFVSYYSGKGFIEESNHVRHGSSLV